MPISLSFIPDEVAQTDSFSSHTRIAEAIAAVIDGKTKMKVIGLLGPWGSGKSTVVKFVRDRLSARQSDEQVYCFTYDAWLHQSDPQRRAFLDGLIRFLISQGITSEDKWHIRLQELNRQIEETDSTTTPALSTAGRFLLPSLLLVPVGMALFGHDWFEQLDAAGASGFEQIAFWLGCVFISLPAIAALLLWGFWRPTWKIWTARFWTTHRGRYQNESILSIFTNRERQVQKNKTVRNPDPTTIEFQEIFREIMKAVAHETRRFIFVVDNLDRLPEEQAIEMWATIRSFFLGAPHDVLLPTVILPIDEQSVHRMYGAYHDDPKTAAALARSFMEKTFDLTFHVTRPVLSGWQAYFESQLRVVFGNHQKGDWGYIAGVLYEEWLLESDPKEVVTPRVINTLVNAMGALWLQWHGAGIQFASIAYYAINRARLDSGIINFVSSYQGALVDFDPNWERSILAIHFGVEPEQAAQVALEQPLRQAIVDKNTAEFTTLSGLPGADLVLDRIFSRAETGYDSLPTSSAIALYDQLDPPEGVLRDIAWRHLQRLFFGRGALSNFDADDLAALRILLKRADETIRPTLLPKAALLLSRVQETALKGDALNHFVAAVTALSDTATSLGASMPRVSIQGDPSIYMRAMTMASGDAPTQQALRSNQSPAKIVEAMATDLTNRTTPAGMDRALAAMVAGSESYKWAPVIEAAAVNLESGINTSTKTAANFLGILKDTANERLQTLVDNGVVLARFQESYNNNDLEAAAATAALLLVSKKPGTLETPDGAAWADAFAGRVKLAPLIDKAVAAFSGNADFELYGAIAAEHVNLQPLITHLCSMRFREGTMPVPDGKLVAEYAGWYTECLDKDLRLPLINEVVKDEAFWAKLQELDLENSIDAFGWITSAECVAQDRAIKVLSAKLEAVSLEVWGAAIEQGTQPYDLAIEIPAIDDSVRITGNLFEALRQHVGQVVSGAKPSVRHRWFALIDLLRSSSIKTLCKAIADEICKGGSTADLLALLTAGKGVIFEKGEFGRHADDTSRHMILPLLASTKGIDWIVSNVGKLAGIIQKSEPDTRDTVFEQIQSLWRAATDDAKERLETARLGLKLPAFSQEASTTEPDTSGLGSDADQQEESVREE